MLGNNIYRKKIFLRGLEEVALAMLFILLLLSPAEIQALPKKEQEISVDTAVFTRVAKQLDEVVVRPKKEKYTKKNNPAVDLMKRVRKNQKIGDPRAGKWYSYDQYDKTTLGLLDYHQSLIDDYPFLTDYLDTTAYGGRETLKLIMKERVSTTLYSGGNDAKKRVVRGRKSEGIDESIADGNIEAMLEDVLREVDIYDNDITLMTNRFVSPLSAIGADYYKYYVTDTLDVEGSRCVQLTFSPRNPESFSFMGNLYVELDDTTGFVKKVAMKVPRTINLNYVDNLYIDQIYEKDDKGKRHKVKEDMSVDICLIPGTQKFYGRRITRYDSHSDEKREDLADAYQMAGDVWEIDESESQTDSFWTAQRMVPLSEAESQMSTLMLKLREKPLFYWTEKALVILVDGYVRTGNPSKFDIGPVNTLFSMNTVEGLRLRVGGMTTAHLTPHWFGKGYVAYGTRDKVWKYKGEIEYSLIKKKYHSREFPVNGIRATYMYDIDHIGQHYLFTNADNIFLSWKRRPSDLVTYRRLARIEYNLELRNQLSFSVWGERIRQESTRWLPFVDGMGRVAGSYRQASFGVGIRYAPGEKFVQEKSVRVPINLDAPVIQLTHEWGPKGLLGADFETCKTEISIQKRWWFSAFGYADMMLKGGKIWSQVQYPALMWPNANLSYTIQPESYSLMNPMEFAIDKYASWDLTYWGNGVLFNRLPLIKKAKLREVVSFRGLYGGLDDRNKPQLHPELYRFPADCDAREMTRKPYMEISAGIDNIFTVLRVDYVWRLSYRDTPNADLDGLRIAMHFTF